MGWWTQSLRLPKPEDALPGCDFMRKNVHEADLSQRRGYPQQYPSADSHNEKFGRLKAEDLVDDRIVRKLEEERLF